MGDNSMSDMNTLLTSIRDAISDNAAIKVFTQAEYSKDHTVFVGIDTRALPGQTDCPCVVLGFGMKDSGEEAPSIEHGFVVSCEVYDENTRTVSEATTYKESILALITAELEREEKSAAEIAAAIAAITDHFDDDPTATLDSNVTELKGVQNLETFRQKVLDAIAGVADIRITKVETTYETVMFFPFFICDMAVTIEQETEFGDNFVQ
jgi:hypothetical protein